MEEQGGTMTEQRNLSSFVKLARQKNKMTQVSLAYKLLVSFSYISKIESNNTNITPPSEELLMRMAEVFNCGQEEIMIAAGKFDKKLLREVTTQNILAATLVRRIQSDTLSNEQWLEIENIFDKEKQEMWQEILDEPYG